jgi:hypothetical protein
MVSASASTFLLLPYRSAPYRLSAVPTTRHAALTSNQTEAGAAQQQSLSARNMAQNADSRAIARKSEICNLSHKCLNLLQSCCGDDFLSWSHINKWVLSLALPFFHHPRAACPCFRRMRRISARQWKLSMPTALQRVYHIHLSILRRQVSPYLLQHLSLYKMHDRSLSPPQPEFNE